MSGGSRPARSNPVNMPHAASKPLMPVVIDGSGSKFSFLINLKLICNGFLEQTNVRI